MTREEAIYIINTLKPTNTQSTFDAYIVGKALTMAIEALEQERSRLAQITQYRNDCEKLMQENEQLKKALEQKTCEDDISRQAVLEMAYDMSEIDGEHFTKPWMVVDVEDIQKLPSVKPQEPKTVQFAKWVAEEVIDEELWELNYGAFGEIACRKLEKLGIVKAKGDEWELVESQESEEEE